MVIALHDAEYDQKKSSTGVYIDHWSSVVVSFFCCSSLYRLNPCMPHDKRRICYGLDTTPNKTSNSPPKKLVGFLISYTRQDNILSLTSGSFRNAATESGGNWRPWILHMAGESDSSFPSSTFRIFAGS